LNDVIRVWGNLAERTKADNNCIVMEEQAFFIGKNGYFSVKTAICW
jgi:hypothetical protein